MITRGGGRGARGTTAPRGRAELGVADDLHVRPSVGELDVGAFGHGAPIADVGDEHIRVAREVAGPAAGDGDRGTVHVHLAVARVVEPRPGEDGIAGLCFGGDGKVEAVVAAGGIDTPALDRLDHLERLAAVVRKRQLAGAAVVRRATSEAELLRASCGPGGRRRTSGSANVREESLAGKVRPGWLKRGRHAEVGVG